MGDAHYFMYFPFFIIVCFLNGYASEVQKLGCNVENENFDLKTPVNKPIYGKEMPTLEVTLKEINHIYRAMNHIRGLILSKSLYNTADIFIDFYDAYIESKKDFKTFFQDYHTKLDTNEDSVGFAIDFISDVEKALPLVKNYLYLIAGHLAITEEQLGKIKQNPDKPQENGFFSTHVAACMRISISGRKGVIIVDPGLSVDAPVLVMDDGGSVDLQPFKNTCFGYGIYPGGQKFVYTALSNPSPFVLITTYKNNPNETHQQHLFYVAKPYCSVLDTTVKPNLLNTELCIIRQESSGKPKVALYFDMKPASSVASPKKGSKKAATSPGPSFTSIVFQPFKTIQKTVPFKRLDKMSEAEEKIFDHIADELYGKNDDQLVESMIKLKAISENTAFFEELEKQHAILEAS